MRLGPILMPVRAWWFIRIARNATIPRDVGRKTKSQSPEYVAFENAMSKVLRVSKQEPRKRLEADKATKQSNKTLLSNRGVQSICQPAS